MTTAGPAANDAQALKFRAILQSAMAAVITIDAGGHIETVNPAAETMFGYGADELIGRNVNMLMPEPYRSQHDTYLAKYLATGRRQIIGIGREVAGLRKDGTTFPMHLSVGAFAIGGARYFTGTIVDLSAQRAAEQRFERERAMFRAIFESLPDPLVICDPAGAIRLVNPSFTRVFGYREPEVLGESMASLFESAETWNGSVETLAAARQVDAKPGTARFRRKSGELFAAEIIAGSIVGSSGSALGRLVLIHDVTAKRQQEALLLQARRMEAAGQLTGGVAHDFNNLLTVILGNLELLEPKLADELSRSLAGEAREAAEMGARLTDRLLTFARRQRLEMQDLNLNAFVLDLTELLRRTIGAPVDLSTALAPDLWPTTADPAQVESAVLNLVLNARDATPDGGRLVIETFNATLDAADILSVPGMAPGDYVVLSVAAPRGSSPGPSAPAVPIRSRQQSVTRERSWACVIGPCAGRHSSLMTSCGRAARSCWWNPAPTPRSGMPRRHSCDTRPGASRPTRSLPRNQIVNRHARACAPTDWEACLRQISDAGVVFFTVLRGLSGYLPGSVGKTKPTPASRKTAFPEIDRSHPAVSEASGDIWRARQNRAANGTMERLSALA